MQLCSYGVMELWSYGVMELGSYAVMELWSYGGYCSILVALFYMEWCIG